MSAARVAIVLLLGLVGGCASVTGFPDRTADAAAELLQLQQYFAPDLIATYDALPAEQRRARRDEIVNGRLAAIDLQFGLFQQAVYREGVGLNIGADVTLLGLGAAGAVVSDAGTSNILSALAGAVTGTRSSIERNAFAERTAAALVAQMVALRKKVLVRIRRGLTIDATEYPLTQALVDLENYYNAGTIPGALVGIVESAGETAARAEGEIARVLEAAYVRDDAGDILRELWRPGGTTDPAAEERLRAWMATNGIDPGSITFFLRSDMFAPAREQAVRDLGLR
jgi:hypothetical protein